MATRSPTGSTLLAWLCFYAVPHKPRAARGSLTSMSRCMTGSSLNRLPCTAARPPRTPRRACTATAAMRCAKRHVDSVSLSCAACAAAGSCQLQLWSCHASTVARSSMLPHTSTCCKSRPAAWQPFATLLLERHSFCEAAQSLVTCYLERQFPAMHSCCGAEQRNAPHPPLSCSASSGSALPFVHPRQSTLSNI